MRRNRMLLGAIALAAALLPSNASARRTFITLTDESLVGSVTVEPDRYELRMAPGGASLTLLRGRTAVTTAGCEVRPLAPAFRDDAVVYRAGASGPRPVSRFLLADQHLEIVMLPAPSSAGAAGDGAR